jgi:phenylacetate-coenzyme A ligase PaaK-like adenylate-forming protein
MKFLLNPLTFYELHKRNKTRHYTPEQLENYQLLQLKKIVSYAFEKSSFYQRKYMAAGFHPSQIKTLEDISLIPILTKPELRIFGEEMNHTCGNKYFVDQTSGSTNTPMRLYRTVQEKAYLNAKFLYALFQLGYRITDRTFSIGVPSRVVKRDSFIQKANVLNRRSLGFDLPIESIAKQFSLFEADVLYGYKSQLLQLGEFLIGKGISFKQPRIVVVAGEIVDAISVKQLHTYFGEQVYFIYGSVEFNNMAYQKVAGQDYQVNEACNFIEQLPPVKNEIGEFIVTDFFLKTMPLIRYQIGDAGTISVLGRTKLIEDISGKIDNYAITSFGKVYDFELIHLIEIFPSILRFQIVQKELDCFEILVVQVDSTFNKDVVEATIKASFDGKLKFMVILVDKILPEANGKLRLIVPLKELK